MIKPVRAPARTRFVVFMRTPDLSGAMGRWGAPDLTGLAQVGIAMMMPIISYTLRRPRHSWNRD